MWSDAFLDALLCTRKPTALNLVFRNIKCWKLWQEERDIAKGKRGFQKCIYWYTYIHWEVHGHKAHDARILRVSWCLDSVTFCDEAIKKTRKEREESIPSKRFRKRWLLYWSRVVGKYYHTSATTTGRRNQNLQSSFLSPSNLCSAMFPLFYICASLCVRWIDIKKCGSVIHNIIITYTHFEGEKKVSECKLALVPCFNWLEYICRK